MTDDILNINLAACQMSSITLSKGFAIDPSWGAIGNVLSEKDKSRNCLICKILTLTES
jgi:hypothetical protein